MIVKSRGPCPDLQNKLRRDSPNMPLIQAPPSLFTDGVTTPKGCHSCPNFVLSLCYSCPNLAKLLLIQCLVRCLGINVLDFYAIQPPLPITRHKMVRFTAIHPICSLLKQTDDGGYLLPNQQRRNVYWNEGIIIGGVLKGEIVKYFVHIDDTQGDSYHTQR